MFCHNWGSLGRKSFENFNALVYTDGALQSSPGTYQQYLRSLYCLEFKTVIHARYQTFPTCKHGMLGPLSGKGTWQHLVSRGWHWQKILQLCSGSLNALVPLSGRLSLQSRRSPCPCTRACHPSSEDVQGGPDIENSSLIISFNCLIFFIGLLIV